eukprot:3657877-Ditylum_brightwellii.AAC.3
MTKADDNTITNKGEDPGINNSPNATKEKSNKDKDMINPDLLNMGKTYHWASPDKGQMVDNQWISHDDA